MYKSSYARKIFYFIAIPLVLFSTNGKAGQPSDKDIVDGAITKYIGDVSVTSMRKKIFDGQVSGTGRASVVGEITLNSATYIPDANKIRKDLENIFPNAEDRKFFNSKTKFNINKYREFYRVENKNGDKFKFRMEL